MTITLDKPTVRAAADAISFRTQAFINGKFVDAASGETFVTENPATGQRIVEVASGDSEDVDRAVKAARDVFERGDWSRRAPAERKKVLLKFADLIEKSTLELAAIDAIEAGKPITDCVTIDVDEMITCIRWHAEAADKFYDQIAPTGPDKLGLILREPIGVVGAIVPWNFPALMAAWKLGPALACGNSVVLKPAELTSLSALRLADLASEAGLPDGVLNVVPGLGHKAGQAIGRHKDIDAITFTGSTKVGRMILQYAAESNLKQVVLECGGKSPQVVMADATDLDMVADNAVDAAFWNMGENCSCGSRLIVDEQVKDALLDKIIARTKEWSTGDPLDPATKVGSMIEKPHMEKVLGFVEQGKASGARLALGGNRVQQESGGYFVEPTIFDDVTNDMSIARDEIFGPVLATITFKTEEEAIALANATNYGLAASLYTDNVHTAHRVARAIKAGTVSVNCYAEGDITTPFGGYKESGFGGRDNGAHAHDQYTELKTIWFDVAPAK